MNNAQAIATAIIYASLWVALLAYVYRPQIRAWRYQRAYDRVSREMADRILADVDEDIDRRAARGITPDRVRKPARMTEEQIRALHRREQWGGEQQERAGEVWGGLD